MKRNWLLLFIVLSSSFSARSQLDTSNQEFVSEKFHYTVLSGAVIYAGSVVALNDLWYADHSRSSFHWYNDNHSWLQMDKAGHFASSYYLGRLGIDVFKWSGVSEKKAVWYGGSAGLLFLTTIEVFDGFSEEWGASLGDMASNMGGAFLAIGQELAFSEQKLMVKYSFSRTDYPQYRPSKLGEKFSEEIFKDYNGQTYWLSANLASLTSSKKIFDWLNVAVGYGAEGMTGGPENPKFSDDGRPVPVSERYRQYYLSLDVDLTRIKSKSKLVRSTLKALNFIKVPFPTIEFSQKGTKFHALYF